MTTRRVAGLAIACFASGCSNLLTPVEAAPASAALLDKLPDDVPQAARPRGVLLVDAPSSRPAYDTTRMAYRLRAHEIEFYARHEWAERPARMLLPLLVRTLGATHCCNAVVAAPYPGPHDFTLRTELHELVQDYTVDPPRVRVAVRVIVFARDRLLATHDLERSEPMTAKNAEAGVTAANEAIAVMLRDIAHKVIEAVASA